MAARPAILALENGLIFEGTAFGSHGSSVGEIIFNTSMTGYQEILTDPSYSKQIITFTYPHIGNVGINDQDFESDRVWASGLIIKDLSLHYSNWRATKTLDDFLKEQKTIGISQIDTRELTHIIRREGALKACIMTDEIDREQAIHQAKNFSGLHAIDLTAEVSTKKPYTWTQGLWDNQLRDYKMGSEKDLPWHLVVVDYGVKKNILRHLVDVGCKLTVVPANYDFEKIMQLKPHAIVLSNGPGDPAACFQAIELTKKIIKATFPLLGICLGIQIIAHASGAKTFKMKFGHHGANHPVQDLRSKNVFITSQNHGFAVDEATLSKDFLITHRSLFDNTIQGIQHQSKPVFAFQGHPEAGPGPNDMKILFQEFILQMQKYWEHQHAFAT